jgi:Fe-S cluster assembly protein SufD
LAATRSCAASSSPSAATPCASRPNVAFDGPGGDAELLGLYFADAGQHLEHRLFVDHAVPHCRSNVTYKGALHGDDAHTVWVGDVLIRAAPRAPTPTSSTATSCSPTARAPTPYPTSRSRPARSPARARQRDRPLRRRAAVLPPGPRHPRAEARRLVVRGFFAELVARIGIPEVEERLLAEIDAELEESVA